MKILITENQFRLIESGGFIDDSRNSKPAVNFDNMFGTNVSQTYKFPFDLLPDEVWDLYYNCFRKKDCTKFAKIVYNIKYEHFPYHDYMNLDIHKKMDIVAGMASCFNVQDIINFSVNDIKGYSPETKRIRREIVELFGKDVDWNIFWVPSQYTLDLLKKQMPYRNRASDKKQSAEDFFLKK